MLENICSKNACAKMFTAEELMPKISPDHLLHPRCLQICMASLPFQLLCLCSSFPSAQNAWRHSPDSFSGSYPGSPMMTHLSLSWH